MYVLIIKKKISLSEKLGKSLIDLKQDTEGGFNCSPQIKISNLMEQDRVGWFSVGEYQGEK